MSSNTCVIVSAMFMYGGVTVTVLSRDILTNNLCKRLLNISILMQFTLMLAQNLVDYNLSRPHVINKKVYSLTSFYSLCSLFEWDILL